MKRTGCSWVRRLRLPQSTQGAQHIRSLLWPSRDHLCSAFDYHEITWILKQASLPAARNLNVDLWEAAFFIWYDWGFLLTVSNSGQIQVYLSDTGGLDFLRMQRCVLILTWDRCSFLIFSNRISDSSHTPTKSSMNYRCGCTSECLCVSHQSIEAYLFFCSFCLGAVEKSLQLWWKPWVLQVIPSAFSAWWKSQSPLKYVGATAEQLRRITSLHMLWRAAATILIYLSIYQLIMQWQQTVFGHIISQ